MPLTKLFVEGQLEIQLFNPVFEGNPLVQQGGSKNALKPRTRAERSENGIAAGYLRDRDFDANPPEDLAKPTIDAVEKSNPIGWRWCRHEIENYLLEPRLVSEATGWPTEEIEGALLRAASWIRDYQIARWAVGLIRRSLPPHYELRTRPDDLNEIDLPPALDSASVNAWALANISQFSERFTSKIQPDEIRELWEKHNRLFDPAFLADIDRVLIWFSGKDLFAGLRQWLEQKRVHPGELRALLRDWVIAHPARALELLPEWRGLVEVVREAK